MVFSSAFFLFCFLPITLAGYFLIKTAWRNAFFFTMSVIFYAWGEPVYVMLLLSSIVLNHTAGTLIHLQRRKQSRLLTEGRIVATCLIANVVLLCYYKYANFLIKNLNVIFQRLALEPKDLPNISLPIGISFFTFQAMSYVIDVYRKTASAQFNFINCALYIVSFPQLVAGPIVRYHDIASQLVSRTVTRRQFSAGIQRFIFGLSKKVLLANPLGEVTDSVFAVPVQEVTTGMAWLGIACYTLQIYFDFSGYSDMAIGLGRFFGFEFAENFDFPYISQSIREFWRRWHISLSTWFRDYVYIPLGGNRVSPFRTYLNLWLVFFLCGLWHGASWNFVVWGALHGLYLVIERAGWQRYLERFWRPLRHGYTLFLVMLGWVVFRAETLTQAVQYLARMLGFTHADGSTYDAFLYCDPKTILILLIGCVVSTPIVSWTHQQIYRALERVGLKRQGQLLLDLGYYALLVLLFLLSAASLAANTYNPFIYYRF